MYVCVLLGKSVCRFCTISVNGCMVCCLSRFSSRLSLSRICRMACCICRFFVFLCVISACLMQAMHGVSMQQTACSG